MKINSLIRGKKENYILWFSWGKHLNIHKNSSILTGKLNLWLQWSLSLGFTAAPTWTERSFILSGSSQSTAVHEAKAVWADLCLQNKVALVSAYECSRQWVRPGACFSTGVKRSQMVKEGLKNLHYQSLCETREKEYFYIRNLLAT